MRQFTLTTVSISQEGPLDFVQTPPDRSDDTGLFKVSSAHTTLYLHLSLEQLQQLASAAEQAVFDWRSRLCPAAGDCRCGAAESHSS